MANRRALLTLAGATLFAPGIWSRSQATGRHAGPESFGIFAGLPGTPTGLAAPTPANTLRVLHWWTSSSERRAAKVLATALQEQHLVWQDEAIPGGAGVGAAKVLRGRVLAGNAPEVTQIVGTSIAVWAGLGLLLEFDTVARDNRWQQVLFPPIFDLIRYRSHVVAAPLGIHRVNWLFYNQSVFRHLNLQPPQTWTDFGQLAVHLRNAGIIPLAQSGEPWQLATLFENLVLAYGGKDVFTDLFVHHRPEAAMHPRVGAALNHLRTVRQWTETPLRERSWTDTVADLISGKAAMMVMGDWAKADIQQAGGDAMLGYTVVPGTAPYHLYSVDTLTMFATDYAHVAAQETLAKLCVDSTIQGRYNQAKGSAPVRRDFDVTRLDPCARASWQAFASNDTRVPSMVHRMATDDTTKNAIIAEIHRYFYDDAMAASHMQSRLASMFRALASQVISQDLP
jgi:glucose/mannose transport system substrate-binding protein